jgi:hypothetical protein
MLSISLGRKMTAQTSTRVKAVNLGGWLVTEGWIKPSLFDGIPNKDFLVIFISSSSFLLIISYLWL